MLEKTILSTLALALFVSCASVNAKQPATLRPIDNLAAPDSQAIAGTEGAILVPGSETVVASDTIIDAETIVTGGSVKRHQGSVLALARVPGTDSFYSGDQAGFATFHGAGSGDTWQLSDLPLLRIAANPDGNLVAVYESDGYTVHRVSVWDWSAKRRLFAKRFKDSVLSLSWSAKGTWLLVGNSSLDGITVLDGKAGKPISLFASQPGMVSFAVTGKSETSIMTFGPSGRVLYTDTANGTPKAEYTAPRDLESPVLFNNGRNLAGILDGTVVIIDATSGKTIQTFGSDFPPQLLCADDSSELPIWLGNNAEEGWRLQAGEIYGEFITFADGDEPTSSMIMGTTLVLGMKSGILYKLSAGMISESTSLPVAIDSMPVREIDDAVSDSSRLFILSEGVLLVSAGPGMAPLFGFDGIDANRLAFDGSSLIFWSDEKPSPVIRTGIDGEVRETLYIPTEPLNALSAGNGKIALIEANAKVVVLSAAGGEPFSYRGIGLQDVLCLPGPSVIVTKSATSRAPNPIVKIDTTTGETVPFNIPGNLFYGIRAVDAQSVGFTGFLVTDDGNAPSTKLVTVSALDASAGTAPPVRIDAAYADEDLAASMASDGDVRYTNLGKGSIVKIDADKGLVTRYPRGYALPKRIVLSDRYVVSVNHDGSITWISRDSGDLETTASITDDGYWKEE